jgi:hypothetical protein
MQLLAGADTTTGTGGKAWFVYDDTVGAAIQVAGVGPGAAVASVSAGPGITITGTSTNPVVNNSGVLAISAGLGISITGTGANPVVNNTGVLSVSAGGNIVLTGTTQNPVINATGFVALVSPGVGISITGTVTNPVVNNTGVLSITAGAGIQVQGSAQFPSINARVIGYMQLGGVIDGAGSLSQWFPGGHSTLPSSDPIEYSIDQIVTAGATAMRYVGDLNNIATSGPCNFYLTCNGVAIPGTSFSYTSANIGGVTDVTLSIPAAASGGPRAGRRSIGLGIFGSGASNIVYLASVTFL